MPVYIEAVTQQQRTIDALVTSCENQVPFEREPQVAEDLSDYIIYALEELASGKHYVGLTRRTLDQRVAAHIYQARRDKTVRPGGLMAALREALKSGVRFHLRFSARIVARARTADEARALERQWILLLEAHKPLGFNDMPGGSSIGGVGNALPLSIVAADGARQGYRSIGRAIAARNAELAAAGQPALKPGAVYARLAGGWPSEEALGSTAHQDKRGERPAFKVGGQEYTRLREASEATGVRAAALRSRLHRNDTLISGGIPDIGRDRRVEATGRLAPLNIAWPGSKELLTAASFAARVGIAKATILHRCKRAEAVQSGAWSPAAMYRFLTTRIERRKVVRLALPDGRTWIGGERELIRRMLRDDVLEASRARRLSASGIRRRLRLLQPAERNDASVAWAFGFNLSQ